jgi:membrane protein DedA with SNARE-associated domain
MLRLKFQSVSNGDWRVVSGWRHSNSRRVIAVLCVWLTLSGAFLFVEQFDGAARAAAARDVAAAANREVDRGRRRFERYIARAEPLLQRYGYAAVAVAVMAEGVGIPTPGQTLLMAGALEAAKGQLNIAWLLFLVTAATIVGNSLGYAIGRWGGRAVLKKLRVNATRQQRFEDIFKRRGGIVILLARFVEGLKQLNGIVAGVMHMPWWTFTAYNIAGAVLWSCAWGLGTYYLGRDIHVIAAVFHRHRRLLYALSATAIIILLAALLRYRSTERESAVHHP